MASNCIRVTNNSRETYFTFHVNQIIVILMLTGEFVGGWGEEGAKKFFKEQTVVIFIGE